MIRLLLTSLCRGSRIRLAVLSAPLDWLTASRDAQKSLVLRYVIDEPVVPIAAKWVGRHLF